MVDISVSFTILLVLHALCNLNSREIQVEYIGIFITLIAIKVAITEGL